MCLKDLREGRIRHVRGRALWRWGRKLNRNELRRMEERIERNGADGDGVAILVEAYQNGCALWIVSCDKYQCVMPVIYDHENRMLVTVLPEGSLHDQARRAGLL